MSGSPLALTELPLRFADMPQSPKYFTKAVASVSLAIVNVVVFIAFGFNVLLQMLCQPEKLVLVHYTYFFGN
jgi:hypothetical protein